MSRRKTISLIITLIVLLSSYFGSRLTSHRVPTSSNSITNTPTTTQGSFQPSGTPSAQQTKTSGCQVNGALPDMACTPGAIFPTTNKEQICVPGYSKSVRNVPTEEKQQVYAEYGIPSHAPGQYEVDHLISLELGGSNDISNLWPQAAEPRPGFHEKDMVENYLHQQVCSGAISLQQAQQEISTNWVQIYQNTPNIQQFQY